MRVHAGREQKELAVEADPSWTVDAVLKKIVTQAAQLGLIPARTVRRAGKEPVRRNLPIGGTSLDLIQAWCPCP